MGSIITFYSFKGGVGRTMALANIAVLLVRLKKKILIVDWDLEAPGLDKYFRKFLFYSNSEKEGLLYLLDDIKEGKSRWSDWRDYLSSTYDLGGKHPLTFLKSGRKYDENSQKEYAKKLFNFDWNEFFNKHDGGEFFESLRKDWINEYDLVLIDSRTGITDSGGICTIQIPDILVLVFTTNDQSLDGVKEVANISQKARQKFVYDRTNLLVFPLASNIEDRTQYEELQEWMKRFAIELKPFFEDWLPKKYTPNQILDRTKLPYVPYFSFGEKLAVLEEILPSGELKITKGLGEAYSTVSRIINNDFHKIDEIISGIFEPPEMHFFEKGIRRKSLKVIRLFLASSMDVNTEHKKVHSVVMQVNRMVGELWDVYIEVIDWNTHVAPNMSKQQEEINRQIRDHDIFVGIMWKRFDTPTGEAISGTEEEFDIAYKNWERFKRPRILFYFSTAEYVIQNDEEYDQLGKVRGFKKRMREKELAREYSTTDEFADLLREYLVNMLREWFSPGEKTLKIKDFSHYVRYLMEDTMYIDIRGLFTGKGKAHRFPIDQLYIPLKTTGVGVEEGMRGNGEIKGERIADGIGPRDMFLQEALKRERLIIKGDPGSGKTTFLRFITYTLCKKWLGEDLSLLNVKLPWIDTYPLPILLHIGALIEHLNEYRVKGPAHPSLKEDDPESIFHFLDERAGRYNWKVSAEDFRAELDSGNCLVLLDGLDEAPNLKIREKIGSLAEKLLKSFPQCQVVLTSRPPALDGPIIPPGFDMVEILPLNEASKDFFLSQWSKELHHESPKRAEDFKKELKEALEARPEIRRMAATPVMLTALAVVHWNEHRLPEQRFELYESIITWLLRSREQRPGRLSADRCRRLLQKLALAMFIHPQGRRRQVGFKWAAEILGSEFTVTKEKGALDQAEEFLCEELVDSGIIVERENRLEFWHLSFQEYLASYEIAGQREEDQIKLLFEGNRLYRSEWREVILLLGGVLYKQGVEKIDYLIDKVIERGPRYNDKSSLPKLAQTAGLLGSILRDLSPFHFSPSNKEYQKIFEGVMGIFEKERYKSIPVQVRIEAADALGQVGDPRLHVDPMVSIPGGGFWMGAQKTNKKERNFDENATDRESPVHQVELSPYLISKYPVTVGQYLRFIEDEGYQEKRHWRSGGFGEYKMPENWEEQLRYPSRPVVYVSWYEAAAYASWCGCRLPTEAEWERAARGPGEEYRKYPWGNDEPTKDSANWGKAGVGKITPVGIFPEDCSHEGLIDTAGNVWEWCLDWYSGKYYEECARKGIAKDPEGPEKGQSREHVDRVLRGGAFDSHVQDFLRCASRDGGGRPGARNYGIGFRVVRL